MAALIFFTPAYSALPDPTRNVTITGIVTLGKAGRPAPASVPKKAEASGQEKPQPVKKPKADEAKAVAQIEKPVQEPPKPEVKPVEKPEPKPEPKPEAAPIPKEPEKKKEAEKKQEKPKPEKKKEPQKKPATTKKESVEDALLALSKETQKKDGKGQAAPKGQKAEDALKDLEKELNQGSGAEESGDGPGGADGDGRGALGAYYEVIISRVKQNWSWTGRADRTVLSALVNIRLSREGEILSATLTRSSGNAFYDSAVLRALNLTTDLEPPPRPDLMNIDIEFASDEMTR